MYYTYAYLREDRTPYYIGKGKEYRINSTNRSLNKPKDKSRMIFLKQNLTEEEAFKHEKYMIAIFGRKDNGTGILRNKSDGGEGVGNPSEETRKKKAEITRKRYENMTLEQKQEIGNKIRKGQSKMSSEQRQKIREALKKGNAKLTPEQRSAATKKGHAKFTPEQRKEIARKIQANITPEKRREMIRKRLEATTPEQRSESAKKWQASRTPEQRSESARKRNQNMTPEQRSERSRKAQASRTPEQRSESAKKAYEKVKKLLTQKWQCIETGYISNAGGLSQYQKKRGIDTSKRILLS